MANPLLGTGMGSVPVTALYGAVTAIITTGLAMNISRMRGKHKIFRGDGGIAELQGAIRAHGNAAEHVPVTVLLLLVAELCGGSSLALHVLGGAFLVARILHPLGMMKSIAPAQVAGAVGTYLTQFALAGYALWLRPWG
jgi:uncharacterized membrane protein YecN with MAPEG domain